METAPRGNREVDVWQAASACSVNRRKHQRRRSPVSVQRAVRLILALLLVCLTGAAAAQSYPTKPIRLVIPFAPGGSNDVFGRVIAAQLTERLGQSVYVDNPGGGRGTIVAGIVVKARPARYTPPLVAS